MPQYAPKRKKAKSKLFHTVVANMVVAAYHRDRHYDHTVRPDHGQSQASSKLYL